LSVNKPFTEKLRECWEDWIKEGVRLIAKGDIMKRVGCVVVPRWVSNS